MKEIFERPLSPAFARAASRASPGGFKSLTARGYGFDVLRYPRGVQGKATGVGENVEDTTDVTSMGGGGEVILALVEEAAGLLARPRMRMVTHLSLAHYYRFEDFAGEDLDCRSEAFATPGSRVAAQQDTGGPAGAKRSSRAETIGAR